MSNTVTSSAVTQRFKRNQDLLYYKADADITVELGQLYHFMAPKDRAGAEMCTLSSTELGAKTSFLAPALRRSETNVRTVHAAPRVAIDLPPGMTMVLGGSGSGKSKFTMGVAAHSTDVLYARYGEPLDPHFLAAMQQDAGVMLVDHEVQLAEMIARFMATDLLEVMIVDSLRYRFYSGDGATGAGGVNMTLFAALTFLDVAVAQADKSLVVVVNPLTPDEKAFAALREVARGSVSCLIEMKDPNTAVITDRYRGRADHNIRLPGDRKTWAPSSTMTSSISANSATSASLGFLTK